jgi:beta-glucanase (GH16 family)
MSEEFGGSLTVLDSNQTTGGFVKFRSDGPTWKAWYPNDTVGDGNQHSNNPGTEQEYYDISGITMSGTELVLTATKDNVHSGLPYTSGMIQSNPSFNPLYGFAEARIKCPATDGSWPAFWMIDSAYAWPPELDIMENFGDATTYKVSNWSGSSSVFGQVVNTSVTSYHTYGLNWQSGSIQWYLDGSVVATETAFPSAAVTSPLYVVLNMAVRTTNTATPQAMQVDYVRFWQ